MGIRLHPARAVALLTWLLLLFASASAFADPPARVGRIGIANGDVSFSAAGTAMRARNCRRVPR